MNYCVFLSQLDEPAKVAPIPDDVDVLDACYKLIDCETVQLVPIMEDRLPKGYDALCDQEIFGKTVCINPLASWIYGADDHGAGIMGNVVILKTVETEEGEDLAFMTEEEATDIADELNKDFETKYDLVVFKVMLAHMKD